MLWTSRGGGRGTPGQFPPRAEATGLISPLGEWVLRPACVQAKAWQDAGLAPLRMAGNLSARQLSKPDLLADIIRILDETGLAPEHLEMEMVDYVPVYRSPAGTGGGWGFALWR